MDTRRPRSPTAAGVHAATMEANRRRLLIAVGLLTVVTLLLSTAATGPGVLPGDVWLARQIQRTPGSVGNPITGAVFWLGSFPVLTGGALVIGGAFALGRRWVEAVLVLTTIPVRGVNPLLKRLIESPRPTDDLIRVTERTRGMGFPSGHSMGVALLYGLSAVLLCRLVAQPRIRYLIWAAALVLMLATGFGRVYSGAHWPSDVLGGYLWAGVVALVLLGVARIATGGTTPPPHQIGRRR